MAPPPVPLVLPVLPVLPVLLVLPVVPVLAVLPVVAPPPLPSPPPELESEGDELQAALSEAKASTTPRA